MVDSQDPFSLFQVRRPEEYMDLALKEARRAFDAGEVLVGALLVESATGRVVARAHNQRELLRDPTAHGADDLKAGAYRSVHRVLVDRRNNHRPEVVPGIRAEECAAILREFFRRRRSGAPGPQATGNGGPAPGALEEEERPDGYNDSAGPAGP